MGVEWVVWWVLDGLFGWVFGHFLVLLRVFKSKKDRKQVLFGNGLILKRQR